MGGVFPGFRDFPDFNISFDPSRISIVPSFDPTQLQGTISPRPPSPRCAHTPPYAHTHEPLLPCFQRAINLNG